MSKIGKIVVEKNNKVPKVIISETERYLSGLELGLDLLENSSYTISSEDIVIGDCKYKKFNNCKAKLDNVKVNNLNIREIGSMTESGYYKLLRAYINYQVYQGGTNSCYSLIRDDVHSQLIKTMK